MGIRLKLNLNIGNKYYVVIDLEERQLNLNIKKTDPKNKLMNNFVRFEFKAYLALFVYNEVPERDDFSSLF